MLREGYALGTSIDLGWQPEVLGGGRVGRPNQQHTMGIYGSGGRWSGSDFEPGGYQSKIFARRRVPGGHLHQLTRCTRAIRAFAMRGSVSDPRRGPDTPDLLKSTKYCAP